MAHTPINIPAWVKKFQNGDFISPDRHTQCEAGWYDWFCKDTSLRNKTIALGNKLIQVMDSPRFKAEECYVFFKNNCPMRGSLYDDFRICSMETGDVIFTVVPRSGHTGKAEVWGRDNDFNGAIVCGTWKDVKNFFASKPE